MNKVQTVTIPGGIDLHVHLREPSTNTAETISSGTKSALLGGYIAVFDMPNNPGSPTWSQVALNDKISRIGKSAYIPVGLYAGSQPESNNFDELEIMSQSAVGLKIYGAVTTGNDKDYKALDFDPIIAKWHEAAPEKPVMLHSGKENLEDFIKLIVIEHKQPLHVCHINNPEDVRLVSKYKKQGHKITCGVCPHHLFLTTHDHLTRGWFARMMPPLTDHPQATELLQMLADGEIDVLETDHAPHLAENKWLAEHDNPEGSHDPSHKTCFGVPGIEFALPLLFYQMSRGNISLERIAEVTSTNPAKIIGLKLSPETKVTWRLEAYRIDNEKAEAISGSGWTPYLGMLAGGTIEEVEIDGKKVLSGGKITGKVSQFIKTGDKI